MNSIASTDLEVEELYENGTYKYLHVVSSVRFNVLVSSSFIFSDVSLGVGISSDVCMK